MTQIPSQAARCLGDASRVLVVTGAGISAESGVPTFRGAGGLWEGFRAEDLATPEAFKRDPELVWRWYRWRRDICLGAQPNPGHRTLVDIEQTVGDFLLVTQNVDGLHARAGSLKMIEIHGNIDRARCTGCGRITGVGETSCSGHSAVPCCGACGARLRPHILWFGETYWPGMLEQAEQAAQHAQVAIVVGTSARVWPPAQIALAALHAGAFLIDINPQPTELSNAAAAFIQGPAAEVLPALWKMARS